MAQRDPDVDDTRPPTEVPFVATRRTLLRAAAATGAATTLGGVTVAQDGQTIELEGVTAGWMGQAPDEIEGEENPPLQLEVGQTYVVEWTNGDGVPHDFAVLDADGNELESTEIVTEQGAVTTLEFEATEEMAEYYCSVHPATMRGDIVLGEGDGTPAEDDEAAEEDLLIQKGPSVGLETVAEGLDSPVDFQVADEEADRRFVVDQPGRIYVHGPDGLEDEPFLDITDRVSIETESFDERGLLGLAFHPDFADNGRFFVRYSGHRGTVTPASWSHTFVVAEFQASDDLATADPESERRLMEIPEPQFNHNAGPLAFGPDGYLYIAIGDGGAADDNAPGHVEDWYEENEGGNAQNTRDTLLGGVLRIDVDTEQYGKPYGIPEDNPLVEMELEAMEEMAEEDEDEEETDDDADADDGTTDATVSTATHDELGEILVDGEGMTLYMFDSDEQGAQESTCYDDCEEAWPPLTVEGESSADEAVDAELTTFEREDGSTQVAANGWPLYYFAQDEMAGDANGQGLNDVWWVLDASGNPVREAAEEAAGDESSSEDGSAGEESDENGSDGGDEDEDEVDVEEMDEDEDEEAAPDEEEEKAAADEEPDLTGQFGHAEYYAWGMRNPWGMSFTDDGELLVADVGQLLFEIINHVERGGNYGWNVKEGVHCFSTENPGEPPEECPDETPEDVRGGEPLLDPVIDYPQEYGVQNIGSAVVGGRLYTNDTIPELQDAYVFGEWSAGFGEPLGRLLVSHPPEGWEDGETPAEGESFADQVPEGADSPLVQEELWEDLWPIEQLRIEAEGDVVRDEDELNRYVLAYGNDAEGELYVLTTSAAAPSGGTGEVHRLVPATDGGETKTPEDEEVNETPEDEEVNETPEDDEANEAGDGANEE